MAGTRCEHLALAHRAAERMRECSQVHGGLAPRSIPHVVAHFGDGAVRRRIVEIGRRIVAEGVRYCRLRCRQRRRSPAIAEAAAAVPTNDAKIGRLYPPVSL